MGEIDELDDGVYQIHYDFFDFNVGVVVGGESVLLIDTRATHRQAREVKEDIGRITTLPVEWVVNSHWHWDHTWGNWEFRAGELWGHDTCRRRLVDHGEADKASVLDRIPGSLSDEELALIDMTAEEYRAELAETVIVPPEKVFERMASIDIGGRTVELSYFGRGAHRLRHRDRPVELRCGLRRRSDRGGVPARLQRRLPDGLARDPAVRERRGCPASGPRARSAGVGGLRRRSARGDHAGGGARRQRPCRGDLTRGCPPRQPVPSKHDGVRAGSGHATAGRLAARLSGSSSGQFRMLG